MTHYYEIRIKGHLDKSWEDWLSGMVIDHEDNGETLITGTLPDQPALHGVLSRLRDLSVELISINPVENYYENNDTNSD